MGEMSAACHDADDAHAMWVCSSLTRLLLPMELILSRHTSLLERPVDEGGYGRYAALVSKQMDDGYGWLWLLPSHRPVYLLFDCCASALPIYRHRSNSIRREQDMRRSRRRRSVPINNTMFTTDRSFILDFRRASGDMYVNYSTRILIRARAQHPLSSDAQPDANEMPLVLLLGDGIGSLSMARERCHRER